MNIVGRGDHKIVIFSEVTESLKDITKRYEKEQLIFVALEGVEDKYILPERSLVSNFKNSFLNHMMWEGLLDESQQLEYIISCCDKFIETGKQMIIEDYDFQEDEPFYDYSR